MRGMNIFACIHDSSAQKHGDEHALQGAEVRHIGASKEVAEAFIRQDFVVEGFGGSPDGAASPDEVIQLINQRILLY
jgi:hypothetical protein